MASDARELERAVFTRKWVGFVAAIWLMVFSGSYAFSNYSQALKDVMGINQKSLNWISIGRDVGDAWAGIVAGFLSNYLPVWPLLCISATFGVSGYGYQWLVVSQTIAPPPYWSVFIAAMASGTCLPWMNTAVFNASVRNFQQNSGPVAGLFKACMGLSGAIFAILCSVLFSGSASMYLLILVIVPNIFCIISAIFFRPVPTAITEEEVQFERKSLLNFNVIASTLAIYIALLDFLPSSFKESTAYRPVAVSLLAAIIAAPAFVPIILFFKAKNGKSVKEKDPEECLKIGVTDSADQVVPLLYKRTESDEIDKEALTKELFDGNESFITQRKSSKSRVSSLWSSSLSSWKVEGLGQDTPTLSLFKTWHYYVLYFSLFCGCGTGMAFSNNLGQIGQSLGFSSVNLFVSLFSLGNFLGRLASGNVSEHFLRLAGVPRPAWMALAKVPMIALCVWLSTGSMASLYVGSAVLGFSHGSLITLTIPVVSEFYGLKHFGTNFVLTVTYIVVGSYAFSSIAGVLYDQKAVSGDDSSSLTCYGSKCYGITFLVMASCLTVGAVCDMILTLISRPLYQNLRALKSHTRKASKDNEDA